MGDVFDAMNRAQRERDDKHPPPGHTPAENTESSVSQPNDDSVSPESADEEKPALPIDQVHAKPLVEDDADSSNQAPPQVPALPDLTVAADTPPTTDTTQSSDQAPALESKLETETGSATPVPPVPNENLNGYAPDIVVHHDRGSVITEQYRAIRTQILARARNRNLQIHVITSSVPQEGKSITAANLGIAFSELRNKQTLIVEGDLRRPCFHKMFDRECTSGLLQLLRGDVTDIDQAIHPTVYDNLQFLPAGGRDPTHCTELLSSPRMAQILDRLRDHYDHIFIDTPPVVSVTDAAILAAMGDQTLLVVRLHKTPVDMVERAKRLLKVNNCNVSGIILTHMNMAFLPGYMSRYSYGSAYA